jgi:hypothetical protein
MKRIAQLLGAETTCPGAAERYRHLYYRNADSSAYSQFFKSHGNSNNNNNNHRYQQLLTPSSSSNNKDIPLWVKAARSAHSASKACQYTRHLFLADGDGIYHNLNADTDTIELYLNGKIKANMVRGGIFQGLGEGLSRDDLHPNSTFYEWLVEKHGYRNTWVFNSGHWDLRDTDVNSYLDTIKELFPLIQVFGRKYQLRIVWNAMPTFSFKQRRWNHNERRNNEDILYANEQVRQLCLEYDFLYVPFAEVILPFASLSCDDHHYLCGEFINEKNMKRTSVLNILGMLNVDLLLHTLCAE